MSFETILGNEQLKTNLARSMERGHVSHFYLISGPEGSGKHTLAKQLGAAILCKERRRPCLTCSACRKVLAGAHPDFITVDDPEKKTVPVDLIRQAKADMYVQPNESDYKIYLFPRAQDMGLPGQNALLKVLEEPPQYGVFILITDNPNKLLPTVRSRCTELKMLPLPEDVLKRQLRVDFPNAQGEDISAAIARSGGFLGQAKQLLQEGDAVSPQTEGFIRGLVNKDPLTILETLVPMEKWKRDALAETLTQWLELCQSALTSQAGLPTPSKHARALTALNAKQLMHIIEMLQKCLLYNESNVSPGAICGYLEWNLIKK